MGPGGLILSTWCVRRSIAPDLSFHRSIDLHLLPACYSEHSMKFYPFFGSRMQKGYLGPSFGSKLESPNEQSTFDPKAKASSDSGWGCLVRPKILWSHREIFYLKVEGFQWTVFGIESSIIRALGRVPVLGGFSSTEGTHYFRNVHFLYIFRSNLAYSSFIQYSHHLYGVLGSILSVKTSFNSTFHSHPFTSYTSNKTYTSNLSSTVHTIHLQHTNTTSNFKMALYSSPHIHIKAFIYHVSIFKDDTKFL